MYVVLYDHHILRKVNIMFIKPIIVFIQDDIIEIHTVGVWTT